MDKKTIPRICEQCGDAFLARKDQVKAGNGRLCSPACRSAEQSQRAKDPAVLASRFWSRVNKDGPVPVHCPELGQCYIWTGCKNQNGYGQLGVGSRADDSFRMEKAHRVAFFLIEGRWPEPCALHKCDRPSCVRREHLREGTQSDNLADMRAKGRHVA